jgi:leader peptidase (prepilin peptidase)/N-methyltransferase
MPGGVAGDVDQNPRPYADLLLLAVSDLRAMILPDRLNALLAAGGFGQSLVLGAPELDEAFLGSILGGGLLLLLAVLFRQIRGHDGLGLGDVKLVSAAGLWVGWQGLPLLLSTASLAALAFIGTRALFEGRFERAVLLPFGPFLAGGTILSWSLLALT